jgi:hypothetical protein
VLQADDGGKVMSDLSEITAAKRPVDWLLIDGMTVSSQEMRIFIAFAPGRWLTSNGVWVNLPPGRGVAPFLMASLKSSNLVHDW